MCIYVVGNVNVRMTIPNFRNRVSRLSEDVVGAELKEAPDIAYAW